MTNIAKGLNRGGIFMKDGHKWHSYINKYMIGKIDKSKTQSAGHAK